MIQINAHSGIYTLKVTQYLPMNRQEAWDFLSNPTNLQRITPEHMGFHITSADDGKSMYPGQIITYKVAPFNGVTMNWVTEITHVEEGRYFVDEQRFGPYSFWHHKHFIEEKDGGVEMTDQVSYKVPFGFLGRMMHGLVIKGKLYEIFQYRYDTLEEMFK
jgi:ligand-binding SRPBCC domain-containing protein